MHNSKSALVDSKPPPSYHSTPMYSFEYDRSSLPALETKTALECLLQWNLDASSLHVSTYRVFGPFSRSSKNDDYEQLLKDFVASPAFAEQLQPGGSCRQPVALEYTSLTNNVRSLAFFDKIKDCSGIISSGGEIKGCFEDTYGGIIVNDMLREVILNPDSEYSDIFAAEDKSQLLYVLFSILVLGMQALFPHPYHTSLLLHVRILYITVIFSHCSQLLFVVLFVFMVWYV